MYKCTVCNKNIDILYTYEKSSNLGPLYFKAFKIRGPEFFDSEKDKPYCSAKCGLIDYDNSEKT